MEYELKLLLKSPITKVVMLLTIGFTVFGLFGPNNSNNMVLHGIMNTSTALAPYTARYGAMSGAMLFALLTLYYISRDDRNGSRSIIESAKGYPEIILMRISAIIVCCAASSLAGLLISCLVMMLFLNASCQLYIHIFSIGMIMLPSLVFSVLISGGLYMIFKSLDAGFIIFAALYFMGFSSENYLLRWIQPGPEAFSDVAGIWPAGKFIIYNRLFWLMISLCIFCAGLLFIRRYGLMPMELIKINLRKGIVPAILILSLISGVIVYAGEPYVFKNDSVFDDGILKDKGIYLEKVICDAELYPDEGEISVRAVYYFDNRSGTDKIQFITNMGLDIKSVAVDREAAMWKRIEGTDRIWVETFNKESTAVEIVYSGALKYPGPSGFPGYITEGSVYLLENSHWLFEPLTNCSDIVSIEGSVKAPGNLRVVVPGRLEETNDLGNTKIWRYRVDTKDTGIGLFAGNYKMESFSAGDADIEFYYIEGHEKYIETAAIKDRIKDIVEYYTKTLGEYPYTECPLKIAETSIYKTGGHSSANVVTIAEYMFNRNTEDLDSGMNYTLAHDIYILAHEISHQWWGTGVEVKEEGEWSCEGLAEYMAYKYVQKSLGRGIVKFFSDGWRSTASRYRNSYYSKEGERSNLQSAILKNVLSQIKHAELYCAMPLMLLKAEETVGEEEFLKRLSKIYKSHTFKTLTYDEFLREASLSKEDMALE